MRWLLVLALVAGCHHQRDTPLHCGHGPPPASGGINPLLVPGAFYCYDAATSCPGECSAVTSPRWSCYTQDGPPAPGTICYPDPAMCLASRPHRPGVGECAEVDAAYCSTANHAVTCQATAAECERTRDLLASALHVTNGPCTAN